MHETDPERKKEIEQRMNDPLGGEEDHHGLSSLRKRMNVLDLNSEARKMKSGIHSKEVIGEFNESRI